MNNLKRIIEYDGLIFYDLKIYYIYNRPGPMEILSYKVNISLIKVNFVNYLQALQCNLQGQLLSLKEKTIKFGGNKYKIMSRHVSTVSCIFATGKQRKPYKTGKSIFSFYR